MLAEGWIKRVLAGINPFEQRIRDYQDSQVNTIVGMISQAGPRAVGDIALNLNAANQAGLIEVYETVLRRGMGLSIEGAPPIDYPPANDALLLAAGRLADLYMLLGNEAYADAADPTIAFGTDHGVYRRPGHFDPLFHEPDCFAPRGGAGLVARTRQFETPDHPDPSRSTTDSFGISRATSPAARSPTP
jgi:hypothetical protein